ncbi:MAG: SIMPL domain-containing protein [Bacteroidota bacterium]
MKSSLLGFVFLFLALQANAQSSTKNFIDQPYSEVTGTAVLKIVPDQIYLHIVLKEKDAKEKTSIATQEKQMLEVLRDIGIDLSTQLSVVDQASNLRDYWIKSDKVLSSKKFELMLKDAKTLGEVFIGLETLEIRSVSVDRVSHSKLIEYRRQVKIDAIKAAKSKAEDMTEALGQKLGPAIYIEEMEVASSNRAANRRSEIRFRANLMDNKATNKFVEFDEAQPSIEFEKIELRAKILVRFALPLD